MSVNFYSQEINSESVRQNIQNKGFLEENPTCGCTYVIQPPKTYQNLFQSLQETLKKANLSISNVRIPHATIIAAKVVDQKPGESWKNLEAVQRVYQAFFSNCVYQEMSKGLNYSEAVMPALEKNEAILAKIASKTDREGAVAEISDKRIREDVNNFNLSDPRYCEIKQMALEALNSTSFELSVTDVKLTSNGSIIFQLSSDEKLLKWRLALILAGQGIAKWPKLFVMKNAWSTVGFTTKALNLQEKADLEKLLSDWTNKNQEQLKSAKVLFSTNHLGALAFRSNDFCVVKRAVFPLKQKFIKKHQLELNTKISLEEKDLALTPYAGEEGITPIMGNRVIPNFENENWSRSMNESVESPNNVKNQTSILFGVGVLVAAIGSMILLSKFSKLPP